MNKEDLNRLKHIPSDEVIKDIADTKAEIAELERKISTYEILGDRMSMFRADAARGGIRERKEFIKKLKDLLETRQKESEK